MIKFFKEHKKIFFIFICFILFILFVVSPVNFDTKIYLEAAQRADTLGTFPTNIVQAWEHKYLLNRLLFYILYKLASIFSSPNNIILFEIIIKALYGLLSYTIVKTFSKNTTDFFKKYNIDEPTVFFILYLVIMASGIYLSLQTEMTALLLLLLSIIFVLKNSLLAKLFSAFIISSLFWLKGVTLLYSVIVLIVMLLAKQKKSDIIFTICWSFIFLFTELICIYYFAPIEATNMYLATIYIANNVSYSAAFNFILKSLFLYKFFYLGIVALLINIICHIKYKNIKLLTLELFSWIILFFRCIHSKDDTHLSNRLINSCYPSFLFYFYIL